MICRSVSVLISLGVKVGETFTNWDQGSFSDHRQYV